MARCVKSGTLLAYNLLVLYVQTRLCGKIGYIARRVKFGTILSHNPLHTIKLCSAWGGSVHQDCEGRKETRCFTSTETIKAF